MILYLTYNDHPSGVYWGQVTDVVEHLKTLDSGPVRLVAFVSFRHYLSDRRAIRRRCPDALVLPMVPGVRNWRSNERTLAWVCRRLRPSGIIGRGVFATSLALGMRDRGLIQAVCFDGRGAYAAEWEEYRVVDDDRLIAECGPLEQLSIEKADMRLAVSEALVAHWRERFSYAGDAHVVIPCTLGSDLAEFDDTYAAPMRPALGWGEEDTVMVYSGSTVGWQSLGMVQDVLGELLETDPRMRILFLCRPDRHVLALAERFPEQVTQCWMDHSQVRATLLACDVGIMLREDTVTNQVASPTKFAEYLSAGLPVLISERLGDLSGLVAEEDLGWVVGLGNSRPPVGKPDILQRERLMHFAERQFSKNTYDHAYRQILERLGGVAPN